MHEFMSLYLHDHLYGERKQRERERERERETPSCSFDIVTLNVMKTVYSGHMTS